MRVFSRKKIDIQLVRTSLLSAVAIILVLGLMDGWFVAVDRCAYAVGSMILDLNQSTQPVDQRVIAVSLYEILETKCDLQDSNPAIILTGTLLLTGRVWLRNKNSVSDSPDEPGGY